MGNHSTDDSMDLLVIDLNETINNAVAERVNKVIDIDQSQFQRFVKERFQEWTKSVNKTITKNQLPLFHQPPLKSPTKDAQKVVSLKSNCALFSHLYIACQTCEGNTDEFFCHENQP